MSESIAKLLSTIIGQSHTQFGGRISPIMADAQDITTLLNRWNDGDQDALDELTPIVYDGLRRLAESAFRSERVAFEPFVLINEV